MRIHVDHQDVVTLVSTASLTTDRARTYTDLDEARHGEAHQRMLRALTRLRVIASADLVAEAERIHEADFARAQMLLASELSEDEWSRLGRARNEARAELLASARKAMGLKSAAVINSHRMRIPYREPGKPAPTD